MNNLTGLKWPSISNEKSIVARPLLLISLLYGLYRILKVFTRYQQISNLKRLYGCKPPAKLRWQLLGIPASLKFTRAVKNHRFLSSLQWLFSKQSHTFAGILPLGLSAIWTDEPANIKALLSDNFDDFEIGPERHRMMLPILGKGIFTSDGVEWSEYRANIRPSFSRSRVAKLDTMETHVQHLIARIPKDGMPVDMQELFYEFTMDTITDFLFGHSVGSLLPNASAEYEEFSSAFGQALSKTIHRANRGFLMDWIPDKDFQRACDTVHSFVDRLVIKALTIPSATAPSDSDDQKNHIYLQELSKSTPSLVELRNHAVNILVAGRDTTASLLSFTLYLLARHKEEWENLCDEVSQLNGELPTFEQLKSMNYARYIINEALRLFPPIPYNTRLARSDTVLPVGGGPSASDPVFVQKGTTVVYSVWSMHRRKDIWGPDASEFRPGRWKGRQNGWEFLPFNGGPRVCIGQTFAAIEAIYVIVRLAQTFESIYPCDVDAWRENLGLTLSTLNGVTVGMTARCDRSTIQSHLDIL